MTERLAVPMTRAEALDPAWLSAALAPVTGGVAVAEVETVEVIRTIATKVRFVAVLADGRRMTLCLKGLLDVDERLARGGAITVLEADFYGKLAPMLGVRVPVHVASVIDRDAPFAIVIMRDLIADGGTFNSALDAFTADQAAASVEQLARLHAAEVDLPAMPWITRRVQSLATNFYMTMEELQALLDGPRGEGLPARTRDAITLRKAVAALAERDLATPDFLVHGDAHAGNTFRTEEGPGLIDWQLLQCGGWALDIAYHLAAVLPVEVAEREERRLLGHYLGLMRGHGRFMPDDEAAWALYREAAVYGYYLWAITRSVDPAITVTFNQRLGALVTRHDSYRLLGL